jgi:hypothetical protein
MMPFFANTMAADDGNKETILCCLPDTDETELMPLKKTDLIHSGQHFDSHLLCQIQCFLCLQCLTCGIFTGEDCCDE